MMQNLWPAIESDKVLAFWNGGNFVHACEAAAAYAAASEKYHGKFGRTEP